MIDFVGKRKLFFSISLALLALALVCSMIFGVNLDIQFRGGSIITYSYTGEIDTNLFKSTVESMVDSPVSLQTSTDVATGLQSIKVSLAQSKGISSEKQVEISDKLHQVFPSSNVKIEASNSVDPTIGKEFLTKSLVAVAFASLLMIVYVGLRFKAISGWSAGVMAVVALLHDVMVIFATFIIFRFPLNDNFIAVVLTILGYSLNDTIVIYDRVRENNRLHQGKLRTGELMNHSINQSLRRSIISSFTTFTAMLVVAIVAYVYNVSSIITFAVPMLVGLISGTYSSICIAGPLWVMWKNRNKGLRTA